MDQPASLLLPESALVLLERVFGAQARAATAQLVEGATNLVVRLTLADESIAVRVPRPETAHLAVDRRSECVALAAASAVSLAPDVVICDPVSGVLVTRWLNGEPWSSQRVHESDAIRALACTLKRLHALPPPTAVRTLSPLPLLRSYWQVVSARAAALALRLASLHTRVLARAAEVQSESSVLCHADLHHRNLIDAGGLRLLDWEYAGMAETYFDLASFAQSNDLTHAEQAVLLEAYGSSLQDAWRFALYRVLFDWVCVLWLAMTGAGERVAERKRLELLVQRVKSALESS